MPYALVEPSGRIAEIAAETFPVAPPLEWIEVGGGITTQHRYENGTVYLPPVEPDQELGQSVEERLAALEAEKEAIKEVLIEENPEREAKFEAKREEKAGGSR